MNKRRNMMVERKCCATCVHYRQHYILSTMGSFHPIWYGHCVTPRLKNRDPDEICEHWISIESPEPKPET